MADNKRIAKNTLFLYFRMMLVMGVYLYTSRVILSTLGIEDYGIYNVVGGLVTMFTFLNGSMAGATSRFLTFELGKNRLLRLGQVFNAALVIHLAIALIIVLLAETVGLWFFYAKMTIPPARMDAAFWVYQISILTTLFSLLQVPYNADIIAHENMSVYAYVGVAESFLTLLVAFVISVSPIDRLVFYAILLCLVKVVLSAFFVLYCRRYTESRLALCRDGALYKSMFQYAGSDLIGNISGLAQGQGLNLLLNIFFGPVVNAARAVAYQVQGAVTQFSHNFFTAVRPQIIKSYAQGDIAGMMQLLTYSSWFCYYLMLIISVPLCLEADYVLSLWLGEYPDHSTTFVVLMIVLCMIQTLKTPRTAVLHATGHLFLANITVGSVLCAAFPLAYVFLKMGGSPESVFWAANITMLLSEVVSVFVVKRYVEFSITHYLLNVHLRCFVVSMLCLAPLYFLQQAMQPGFARLAVVCLASVGVISSIAYFIGIDSGMRHKLISIIKKRLNK